jgi:hypothetical protein
MYIFINILIHHSNPTKGLHLHFQWIAQSVNFKYELPHSWQLILDELNIIVPNSGKVIVM